MPYRLIINETPHNDARDETHDDLTLAVYAALSTLNELISTDVDDAMTHLDDDPTDEYEIPIKIVVRNNALSITLNENDVLATVNPV